MGVPGPKTTNLEDVGKRFSDDILKIELSGPEHRHLSVVDVPGLFHSMQIIYFYEKVANFDCRSDQVSNGGRPRNHPKANRGLYDRQAYHYLVSQINLGRWDFEAYLLSGLLWTHATTLPTRKCKYMFPNLLVWECSHVSAFRWHVLLIHRESEQLE